MGFKSEVNIMPTTIDSMALPGFKRDEHERNRDEHAHVQTSPFSIFKKEKEKEMGQSYDGRATNATVETSLEETYHEISQELKQQSRLDCSIILRALSSTPYSLESVEAKEISRYLASAAELVSIFNVQEFKTASIASHIFQLHRDINMVNQETSALEAVQRAFKPFLPIDYIVEQVEELRKFQSVKRKALEENIEQGKMKHLNYLASLSDIDSMSLSKESNGESPIEHHAISRNGKELLDLQEQNHSLRQKLSHFRDLSCDKLEAFESLQSAKNELRRLEGIFEAEISKCS